MLMWKTLDAANKKQILRENCRTFTDPYYSEIGFKGARHLLEFCHLLPSLTKFATTISCIVQYSSYENRST